MFILSFLSHFIKLRFISLAADYSTQA